MKDIIAHLRESGDTVKAILAHMLVCGTYLLFAALVVRSIVYDSYGLLALIALLAVIIRYSPTWLRNSDTNPHL